MDRFEKIAEHADTHDFSTDMQAGTWEDDTVTDPMVTTSLRLPKSLLDWVRAQAEAEHVRPSVLIRRWISQRRDLGRTDITDLAARTERLERAVFPGTHAS